jgi:hypothetical protein
MNINGRIYPDRFDAAKLYAKETLELNYNSDFRSACFDIQNVKTIQNKGHARAIRKKTGFKEIVTGDIFYNKLWWHKNGEYSQKYPTQIEKIGMAIVRNKKVIWYSMPGPNPKSAERKVLTEKSISHKKQSYILGGILKIFDFDNINY